MIKRLLLVSSILLLAACADEESEIGVSTDPIVNGSIDNGHKQVVKIRPLADPPPGASVKWCTGTLVTPRMVLTAGHCLFNGAAAYGSMNVLVTQREYDLETHKWIEYQEWITGAGLAFTNYNAAANTGNDVGVIHLDWDVTGITPAKLATSVYANLPLTLVGFGATSGSAPSPNYGGSRRYGYNNVDSVDAAYLYFSGATGSEAATCYGDSGGPAFGGGYASNCVVGVTKGQSSGATCVSGIWRHSRVDSGSAVSAWIAVQASSHGKAVASCVP